MRRFGIAATFAATLAAIASALAPGATARDRPLSVEELTKLSSSGVPEARLLDIIKDLGIAFAPTNDVLGELRQGGVPESVIQEVRKQIPRGQSAEFYMQAGDRLNQEGRADEAAEYYRLGQGSPSDGGGKKSAPAGTGSGVGAEPVRSAVNPLSSAGSRSEPEDEDFGEDFSAALPGVDMNSLSAAGKRRVLARLEGEPCPCGCKFNVAECRVKDPACQVSLGLANKVVQEVAASIPVSAGSVSRPTSQSSTGIFVNERELTPQQVQQIKSLYMFVAPPGRYWYDERSGLWGMMGREPAGFLRPGHDFGPMPANPSNGNTGVFINGREINMAEAMYCQQVFGAVYQGQWWLDGATGNLGMEGNPTPLANVYMLLQQRQRSGSGGGYSWSSKNTGAYGGSDGSCSYVAIPGSGTVMTGNCD